MKFGKDSLVICLEFKDNNKDNETPPLKYSEILQQIGRSSRTRGISLGHVLIEGTKSLSETFTDVDHFIKGKKERNLNLKFINYYKQLVQLYSKTDGVDIRDEIAKKFGSYNSWRSDS